MSWNGSNNSSHNLNTGETSSTFKNSIKACISLIQSHNRLLLSGLIIVTVGIILTICLISNNETPIVNSDDATGSSLIVSVTPSIASNRNVEVVPQEKPHDLNARPTKVGEHVNGYVMLASGRIHKIRGEITNDMSSVKADYEIFDHYCENEIACLLSLKPGDTIIGDPPYRGRLAKDFIESLKHPIIINENDSEYEKELKSAVRDTKIELKAAMDRGEDIERILLDSRAECRRLAEYKRLIQQEIRKQMHNKSISAENLSDYVSAANKLLESKGIAPLNVTPLMRRKLVLDNLSTED